MRTTELTKLKELLESGKSAEEILEAMKPKKNGNGSYNPPPGGIGIRRAAAKYKLCHTTLIRWVLKGFIPVLAESPNWKYIDEKALVKYLNNKAKN